MPFSFPSLPPSFLISDAAPPQALQHSPNLAQFRGTLAKDVMWNKDFQRTSTVLHGPMGCLTGNGEKLSNS